MSVARILGGAWNDKPLRLRIGPWLDVVLVADPEQIRWLNRCAEVVRPFDPGQSVLHRLLDARLRDLLFGGEPLPVFRAREDVGRAERQQRLEQRFEGLRGLPGSERNAIAAYVAGAEDVAEIGPAVQQWCGQLFSERYRSTPETYRAGKQIAEWPSAPPWRTLLQRWSGGLNRAKALLLSTAEGDVHCVHATSIGMENIARTVRKLRKAARDPRSKGLSPDDILRECLVVPAVVVRGCSGEVAAPFLDRPLTSRSLILFLVGRAFARSGDLDDAFLADDWSACPAREVVPEMLRAVWYSAHHGEVGVTGAAAPTHGWSRLWQRAAS